MNKKILIGLLILISLMAGGYFICQGMSNQVPSGMSKHDQIADSLQNKNVNKSPDTNVASLTTDTKQVTQHVETNEQNNIIPSNWKTYTNGKLGITFQYPNNWTQDGQESNAINREGSVMSIMENFIDTVSHSTFFIEYHVVPYGAELYKYEKAQFNSSQGAYATGAKQIEVAGNKALEAFTTMTKDIKGNIINPPLKIIFIHFLDKQQTGEYALRFATPLPNDNSEITKFKKLVSTLKFAD